MKNKSTLIFVALGILLVTVVLILISQGKKRYDWYETYEVKSKDPYGTYVAGELLKNYYPGKKFNVVSRPLKNALPEGFVRERINYIFIGKIMEIDSSDVSALLSFVDAGNNAFISASDFPLELMTIILPDTCRLYEAQNEDNEFQEPEYYYVTSVRDTNPSFNFYADPVNAKKSTRFHYAFMNKPIPYPWSCFDSSLFCGRENEALIIGYMGDGYINYLKVHYGSGDFYLHTAPLVFTNYCLMTKDHLDYASRAFSFLPPGDIFWDEYNKIPGNLDFDSQLNISQSPLQYVLSQNGLRWAWYCLLLLLLLYAFFFARRRQRVIPVLEPVTNTSLEFIQTIGQLYYQQQNHHALGIHKIRLFQAFIRNRYFILTNQVNEDVIKKISVKSQRPFEEVNSIFTHAHLVEKDINLTQEELIQFHNLLETFYKNCK